MSSANQRADNDYPSLDDSTRTAIASRLVEVVSLSHPEGLTDAQRDEIVDRVAAQLAATERLHQFALSNSAEPAFVMPARQGGSR